MKITTREKILVSLTLALIFIVLYFNFFYKNIFYEINTLKDQINRNKNDFEDIVYSQSQIEKLKKNISDLQDQPEQIFQTTDIEEVNAQIIVFIEDSIDRLGLGTKIKFHDSEQTDEYNVITITLNFEAGYDNIKRIISNIEKAPWPLIMDHIKINRKQSDFGNSPFDWDVEVVLHFLIHSS
ncbi:MAG: hypothetical protein WBI74_09605 [Caldicoprobacterales bacterium]|nr:hypothetical protein [Clostridiales bacterium]